MRARWILRLKCVFQASDELKHKRWNNAGRILDRLAMPGATATSGNSLFIAKGTLACTTES